MSTLKKISFCLTYLTNFNFLLKNMLSLKFYQHTVFKKNRAMCEYLYLVVKALENKHN